MSLMQIFSPVLQPWWVLANLYHWAKFGWNRCSCFGSSSHHLGICLLCHGAHYVKSWHIHNRPRNYRVYNKLQCHLSRTEPQRQSTCTVENLVRLPMFLRNAHTYPFYGPLVFVWDYPGEPVTRNTNGQKNTCRQTALSQYFEPCTVWERVQQLKTALEVFFSILKDVFLVWD